MGESFGFSFASEKILREISMSKLLAALLLGGYSFLILPAIVLIAASFFDRSQTPGQPSRSRLLTFLTLTALVLALLGLLIWFNPYGREISSSLPAFGMLVVLVALLVYLLHNARALTGLWTTDKALFILFALAYLGLFIFLGLADLFAFSATVVLALTFALILYLPRAGYPTLGILSLLTLAVLIFTTGGGIYIPGADLPAWSRTAFSILTVVTLLTSILLPAGLLYASLRVSTSVKKPHLLWSLLLSAILLAGSAYQLLWEGIWSSAHARAFEDHLPFAHFMLSLIAGVLLALMLRGYKKWTGPLYTFLVTTIAVLAFVWGWNLSAFEMTERRAATLDQAIVNYHRDHGLYPASLADLSPRYLLFLSPPVVVRTGGWCYQSTEDSYRLGYISGDFTYFEREFKVEIFAQRGELPAGTWACDELRTRFEAMELVF
jgi:hypothetical protein